MKMRSFCCIMIAAGLLCVCGTGRTDAGLPSTLQEFAEELEIHAAALEDHFTIRCPSGLMDQLKKPSAIGKDETVLSDLRCKAGSNGSCMLTIHDDRIEFSEVTYYAGWRILCLYRSGREGELSDREQQTLEAVINARAAATSVKIDPSNMTDTDLKKFQDAQGELAGALSRLIAVSESYPELKANQNFLELQSQLEGTENRITVERQKFNDVARAYNTEVRTFPTVILASIFGFDKRPYFESQAGADKAPKVDFGA